MKATFEAIIAKVDELSQKPIGGKDELMNVLMEMEPMLNQMGAAQENIHNLSKEESDLFQEAATKLMTLQAKIDNVW